MAASLRLQQFVSNAISTTPGLEHAHELAVASQASPRSGRLRTTIVRAAGAFKAGGHRRRRRLTAFHSVPAGTSPAGAAGDAVGSAASGAAGGSTTPLTGASGADAGSVDSGSGGTASEGSGGGVRRVGGDVAVRSSSAQPVLQEDPRTTPVPAVRTNAPGGTAVATALGAPVHVSSPLRPRSAKPSSLRTATPTGRRPATKPRSRTPQRGRSRKSMQRVSMAKSVAMRIKAAVHSRALKQSGLSAPVDLRWQSLHNGTVRLGWHVALGDSDTVSTSSGAPGEGGLHMPRFLVQVATAASRGPLPRVPSLRDGVQAATDDEWTFANGLVLELTVDEQRVAGLRLPTCAPTSAYRFRVARVDHGCAQTWSHPLVFWNDAVARGGASKVEGRGDRDRLMSTPRWNELFASPKLPRLTSFDAMSGLSGRSTPGTPGDESSVGADSDSRSTPKPALLTHQASSGSIRIMELGDPASWRKNPLRRTDSNASTIMRIEAAKAAVREKRLLAAAGASRAGEGGGAGGAGGAGAGAGAGGGESVPGLEHVLSAKTMRSDGDSLWGAESVRSVLTDATAVDRSVPSVVIDHGSADLKLGLSTSTAPAIYRSITSAAEANAGASKLGSKGMASSFIGTPVLPAQMVKLQYPVRRGRIVSYPRVKKLWTDALANDFDTDFEDRAVTLSAPLSRDLSVHARAEYDIVMTELMEDLFDTEWVSALRVHASAPLALYAQGSTSGLVVDVGDQISQVVPVMWGHVVDHGVQDVTASGLHITKALAAVVERQTRRDISGVEAMERMRDLKERVVFVAPRQGLQRLATEAPTTYELPDGSEVSFTNQAAQCAELLFTPETDVGGLGRDTSLGTTGTHSAVLSSFAAVDHDMHSILKNNVLLSGGSTSIQGLPERLQVELDAALGQGDACVRMFASDYRNVAEWIGGSVVAAMWQEACPAAEFVTKEEWFEWGPAICHRKFAD